MHRHVNGTKQPRTCPLGSTSSMTITARSNSCWKMQDIGWAIRILPTSQGPTNGTIHMEHLHTHTHKHSHQGLWWLMIQSWYNWHVQYLPKVGENGWKWLSSHISSRYDPKCNNSGLWLLSSNRLPQAVQLSRSSAARGNGTLQGRIRQLRQAMGEELYRLKSWGSPVFLMWMEVDYD